ncbi:porin [Xylophilus sp. GOD-11R]|uniref:porin n=1 Tax=Xylophilus sp. GOD-11R TaxID=3089814 RepID=UPI00298D3A7B|nr:porin [Xylophilus sp. GOD-11R]WPB56527.1 porin [Xylophilus sp. GOD-11R]
MKMKLKLVALSALFATGAMAQSSVTIYGVVDAGVASVKNTGTGRVTGLITGGNTVSRLGFRGVEDLGGGLAASFVLEGALNNDVGGGATQTTGLDFQRRSTVSLSNAFGELRLGRDFLAHYHSNYLFDVTANRGLAQIEVFSLGRAGVSTANGFRTGNSVSYFLPATLGGVYGQLQYAFSEVNSRRDAITGPDGLSTSAANAATDKTGSYMGGRLGYLGRGVNVAVSYAQWSDAVRTVGASSYADDYKIANLGASYDFGFIKPMAFVQNEKMGGQGAIQKFEFNTYSVGATAPVGAGLIRVQASRYDQKSSTADASKFSAEYIYNLSVRTSIYTEVARISNQGSGAYSLLGGVGGLSSAAPTGGGKSTGFAVGLKHTF